MQHQPYQQPYYLTQPMVRYESYTIPPMIDFIPN